MKSLKFIKTAVVFASITAAMALTGCAPNVKDELKEIGPNETAFLIQMDGDTMKDQNKFQSVEFLDKNRIATKRVVIPHRLVDLCRNCTTSHEYAEVATAKLILINRSPITREWTSTATTGTSAKIQAFNVESSESIDFSIGAVLTAHISEKDSAKFLYNYGGKQLEDIADTNIRGFIATELSQEFGSNTLDYGRTHKVDIFRKAFDHAKTFFADKGITIDNLGFSEGMTYHDVKIQNSINQKFEAEQQAEIAKKTLEAAETNAKAKDAVKAQKELDFRSRELDIQMVIAQKWDGHNSQVNSGGNGINVHVPLTTTPK
jgi:hypothetical protein